MNTKMKFLIAASLMLAAIGCSSNNSNSDNANTTAPKVEEMASSTQDSIKKTDSTMLPTAPIAYNFMDKVPGTYTLITKGPDYISNKVVVKVSGKKLIVDGEKFRYDVVFEKQDTLIRFSSVSEESGDFLGGGTIIINGPKVTYKMFFGPEANEEYLFQKKN